MKMKSYVSASFLSVLLLVSGGASLAAPPGLEKIGSIHIPLLGIAAARVERWELTVERNAPGQIGIVVTFSGAETLPYVDAAAMLGGNHVAAELSGPGLAEPLTLSDEVRPASKRIALRIPALAVNGTYQLSNIRLVFGRDDKFEVSPGYMIVNVVDPAPVPPGIVVR